MLLRAIFKCIYKIINRFSKQKLDVAPSYERGKNPFPKDWRMHAFFMDALPILNEKVASAESKENTLEAYEDIIDKLKKQKISSFYYLLDH